MQELRAQETQMRTFAVSFDSTPWLWAVHPRGCWAAARGTSVMTCRYHPQPWCQGTSLCPHWPRFPPCTCVQQWHQQNLWPSEHLTHGTASRGPCFLLDSSRCLCRWLCTNSLQSHLLHSDVTWWVVWRLGYLLGDLWCDNFALVVTPYWCYKPYFGSGHEIMWAQTSNLTFSTLVCFTLSL